MASSSASVMLAGSGQPNPTPSLSSVLSVCWSEVLKHLTVKETVRLAKCSRDFREWSRREVDQRALHWTSSASKAWECDKGDKSLSRFESTTMSADDMADDKLALGSLEAGWRCHHNSPSHLFKTIARWCGGWPQLLHARETTAKSQPKLLANGNHIEVVTLGENDKEGRIALLFDIHCNGRLSWSGVYPLQNDNIGSMCIENEDGGLVDLSVILPFSSQTKGDSTDAATIHPLNHGGRPSRYLLSTNALDPQTWRFNVSMVSPKCSETLIISHKIVPRDVTSTIYESGGWEENSGYHSVDDWKRGLVEDQDNESSEFVKYLEKKINSVVPNKELLRCSEHPESLCMLDANPTVIGLGNDGHTREFEYVGYSFCYWLDKRNAKSEEEEKLHITLEFQCEDDLWSAMILNPSTNK